METLFVVMGHEIANKSPKVSLAEYD